jgi:hypothetical protein
MATKMSLGVSKGVSGYQIYDAVNSHTDQPVTEDIDAPPTQDTAEPLAEASEAPVDETAPAQDTVLGGTRPRVAPSLEGPRPLLCLELQWTTSASCFR